MAEEFPALRIIRGIYSLYQVRQYRGHFVLCKFAPKYSLVVPEGGCRTQEFLTWRHAFTRSVRGVKEDRESFWVFTTEICPEIKSKDCESIAASVEIVVCGKASNYLPPLPCFSDCGCGLGVADATSSSTLQLARTISLPVSCLHRDHWDVTYRARSGEWLPPSHPVHHCRNIVVFVAERKAKLARRRLGRSR